MKQIFNLDNPVWQFIGRLIDVVVLHIIWFVVSLGIVTFGPATTALYYALMKDISDENPHYIKAFFKSFKENFKQGAILGLIFLVSGGVIGFAIAFYILNASDNTVLQIAFGISIVLAVLWFFTFTYAFPLLARFVNTIPNILKTSLLMSIRHIGWTIVMVGAFILVYVVAFGVGFLPMLILGYGAVALLNSYILNHVFKPYIKAAGGDPADEDPDHWEIPEEETPADEVAAAEAALPAAENTEEQKETEND